MPILPRIGCFQRVCAGIRKPACIIRLLKLLVLLAGLAAQIWNPAFAAPGPGSKLSPGPWRDHKLGKKCVGTNGKVILLVKRLTPSWDLDYQLEPDFRSTTYAVSADGWNLAVFDYKSFVSTVTFYMGGCKPIKTVNVQGLEAAHPMLILHRGDVLAFFVAVDYSASEDYFRQGFFMVWDSSGNEKIRAGQYLWPQTTENLRLFHDERFGFLNLLRGEQLYLDFQNGKFLLVSDTALVDGGGGPYISPEGVVTLKRRNGYLRADGARVTDSEFMKLWNGARTEGERQALIEAHKPNLEVTREYRF